MSCTVWVTDTELSIRQHITNCDLQKLRLVQLTKFAYPEKTYSEIMASILEDMAESLKK